MLKRSREEKVALVKQWKESGKTMAAWCHEHLIPKTTLFSWVYPKRKKNHESPSLTHSDFIELQKNEVVKTGVTIESQGIKIHLEKGFDSSTLEQCLKILIRQ
jgi:transposase-like protein